MSKKLLLVVLFLLFAVPSHAGTYYVSSTGTATWANCEDAAGTPGPKTGTAACSLSTANTNAAADDIVYLRAGTYTITTYGINPTNSGTSGHVITFSGYEDEVVTITGAAALTGRSAEGILLSNDSYIKVTKINFTNLFRGFTITGGGHNEISYCTFAVRDVWADYIIAGTNDVADATGVTLTDNNPTTGTNLSSGANRRIFNITDGSVVTTSNSATTTTITSSSYPLTGGSDNKWDIGDEYVVTGNYPFNKAFLDIAGNSTHNYIHHCTAHGNGGFAPRNGVDGAPVFMIGTDAGSEEYNSHTTIEYNHMYDAGHKVIGVNKGQYQVVRNNYFHNEAWFDDTDKGGFCAAQEKCGYRVVTSIGPYGGLSLWENNTIGYGAQYGGGNLATGGSGSGMSLGNSSNIIRYNAFVGNVLVGLRYGSSMETASANNRTYNNTFYKNGYNYGADGNVNEDDEMAYDDQRVGAMYYEDDPLLCYGNVTINNLFHSNWAERNDGPYSVGTYYPAFNPQAVGLYNVNTQSNNYQSVDALTYPISKSGSAYAAESPADPDDIFTSYALPANSTAIKAAWSSYAVTVPDLTLKQTATAIIDQGTNLTTVHVDDTSSGTSLILVDNTFFQAGNDDCASPAKTISHGSCLSVVAGDWIAIGATVAAAELTQIVDIAAYSTTKGTVTISPAVSRSDGDKVWLYKTSVGAQVLYGTAPDYGAHEFNSDETGEPPSYNVTVSKTGDGCTLTHDGVYAVEKGNTLNVGLVVNNGWKGTWSGTCSSTGEATTGSTRVCTPAAEQCGSGCTVAFTCSEIYIFK